MVVFFESWVGTKYKYGMKFDANGDVKSFQPKEDENEDAREERRKKEGFCKVMVLGLEHYCTEEHCEHCNDEQRFYISCLERIKSDPNKLARWWIRQQINSMIALQDMAEKIRKDMVGPKICATFSKEDKAEWENAEKYADKLYVLHAWLQKYEKQINHSADILEEFWEECKTTYHMSPDDINAFKVLQLSSKNLADRMLHATQQNAFLLALALERVLSVNSVSQDSEAGVIKTKLKAEIKQLDAMKQELLGKDTCKMHGPCCCTAEEVRCIKCFHLPICRKMTVREITGFVQGLPESPSHKMFRTTLFNLKGDATYWNYLLFANLFQRGMPCVEAAGNEFFRKPEEVQQWAVHAFVENFRHYKPDILFVWGKDAQNTLSKENLQAHQLSLKDPLQSLSFEKSSAKVLQEGGHKCLVLFLHHPGQFFPKNKTIKDLALAWANYTNLIK